MCLYFLYILYQKIFSLSIKTLVTLSGNRNRTDIFSFVEKCLNPLTILEAVCCMCLYGESGRI